MPNTRVLVADDNDNFREMLAELLTHEGYAIDTVSNGDDLASAAILQPPRAILADVHLPGLSTLEALRRARQAGVDSAIILMTDAPNEDTRRAAAELGVVFMLEKPFGFEALRTAVHACTHDA